MKYINAKFLLPDALVKELQHYIQGGYLYIPTDQTQQKCWGEKSGYRQELQQRNCRIRAARRLAGASGRAVLSVYPCHPENHLPKITDGDRDKAVPVFFIQIGSARFGR